MIILYLLVIPVFFILTRLILFFIVLKYGKFSYDGFSVAGFSYNSEKDIFYSTMNAWQKNFGYTHMYDVLAPVFRMIIDTEPVRFNYNGKNWLITFWKGQYGIVTGAEVGIYCTKQKKVDKKTIYLPVSDEEMLDMDLVLYRKGKVVTEAKAKHWWLAIFKLGMFSRPKDLTVDIKIDFPNQEMLVSFLGAFKKIGYKSKDFTVDGNTFSFKFKKPKTRKVWTRIWITDSIRQYFNRKNVELYNSYLEDLIDDNKIDDSRYGDKKLIMVNELIPDLLKNTIEDRMSSKKVVNKIFSQKEKNIVFLDSKVYSGIKESKL